MHAMLTQTRTFLKWWMLAAVLAAATAATAAAQTFKSDEPKLTSSEASVLYSDYVNQVRENVSEFQKADSRTKFEQYFKDYLFPTMTQTSAESLRELGLNRDKLLRCLQQPPIHDAAFQLLTTLTFDAMQRIATDNYDPRVRYNAMLVIGSLNEQPGDANQSPPPLPEATDFMLQALQADASRAPDVVKLGALIGLERHAASGLPEDKRKAVTDELVKLITSPRPDYRTSESHAWLQFRAIEVVTQFGELGENNRVHNAIIAFISNDDSPLVERIHAAKSLERLTEKYTPQCGIDGPAAVAALGNVLADVMESEKTEAFKFNQEKLQGGFGGGYQQLLLLDEEPPGYAKGRFLQRINYVLAGFAAVEAALPDDLKQEVQGVLALVQEVRDVALDRRVVEEALPIKIEQSADQIVAAAESLGHDPGAATANNDDEGLSGFGAQP